MKKDSNKRRDARLDCGVLIDGKSESVFCEAKTVDFSQNGIGLVSRIEIPVGQEVTIEIDIDELGDPAFVVGVVKWADYVAETDSYRVGVYFKDVLRGSKGRLKKYFSKKKG